MTPLFSLIVPTRGRPELFRRLLASLRDTADRPDGIEVIAVVDADDPASLQVTCDCLALKQVVVPPGLTMGALNMAGYEAATGRYLMLLNDDVIPRTSGWDAKIETCFAAFPDEMILVHVNDTVMQKALCTFPIVSRKFCDLAGGICPKEYVRYRIDDHIEDVFNLLGVLGERRILYLPDVVFEHENHVTSAEGVRQYFADPAILALDAPLFDQLIPQRQELALQVKALLDPHRSPRTLQTWRAKLARIADPFSLRSPERQRVITDDDLANPSALARRETWWRNLQKRVRTRVRQTGYRGLAQAAAKKILRAIRVVN